MHNRTGFTLVELLIVVTVIVAIAGISVPSLLSSKAVSHESAVVGTLRAIASAQFQFKAHAVLDRDRDGSHEFGTLGELSGGAPVRQLGEPLAPSLLSRSMGGVDAAGRLFRQGYLFALFLPDSSGVGQPETSGALPSVDPSNAELAWTALAWPSRRGVTGRVTYFVNQEGEILKSRTASYSGTASVPPAGAALIGVAPGYVIGGSLAINATGADGNDWTTIR